MEMMIFGSIILTVMFLRKLETISILRELLGQL